MKNKITNPQYGGSGPASTDNLLQSSNISTVLSSESTIISTKIKDNLTIHNLDKKGSIDATQVDSLNIFVDRFIDFVLNRNINDLPKQKIFLSELCDKIFNGYDNNIVVCNNLIKHNSDFCYRYNELVSSFINSIYILSQGLNISKFFNIESIDSSEYMPNHDLYYYKGTTPNTFFKRQILSENFRFVDEYCDYFASTFDNGAYYAHGYSFSEFGEIDYKRNGIVLAINKQKLHDFLSNLDLDDRQIDTGEGRINILSETGLYLLNHIIPHHCIDHIIKLPPIDI